MDLTLQRQPSQDLATIGSLSINGAFFCYALEDQIRETSDPVERWKIKGCTAIPAGTYKLAWTSSQRFKRKTLQLMAVPGFEGIRIHPGNTKEDTEGCILLGMFHDKNTVTQSRVAVQSLEALVVPLLEKGEEVFIAVLNP